MCKFIKQHERRLEALLELKEEAYSKLDKCEVGIDSLTKELIEEFKKHLKGGCDERA